MNNFNKKEKLSKSLVFNYKMYKNYQSSKEPILKNLITFYGKPYSRNAKTFQLFK